MSNHTDNVINSTTRINLIKGGDMTAETEQVTEPTEVEQVVDDTPTQAKVVPHQSIGLRAVDRCDGCGAPACIRAEHLNQEGGTSELMLCKHHGDQHWDRLVETATLIDDHRPFLLAEEGHARTQGAVTS